MLRGALVLAAVVALAVPMGAHHFFSTDYFEGQRATIEGEVVRFEYRNPHSELVVAVRTGDGVEQWRVEWDAALHLSRTGVAADTLAPGQRVVISGSPGRDPAAKRLRLRVIERPADGWRWPPPK